MPEHTIKDMSKYSVKELLLAAYRSSSMELAEFSSLLGGEKDLPTTEKEVTPFIRERTRLYRHSWLVTPLQEALDKLGFEVERREVDKGLAKDPRTWSNRQSNA